MSNTDSFIEEVTEEVRKDRLYKVARKYGWLIIVFIISVVLIIAALEYLDSEKLKKQQALGDVVADAILLSDSGNSAKLLELSTSVENHSIISKFHMSQVLVRGGEKNKAIEILKSVSKISDIPIVFSDLAKLNIYFLLKTESDEAQILLDKIISSNSPYRLLALEQKVIYRVSINEISEALDIIEVIKSDLSVSSSLKSRMFELKKIISDSDED